MPTTYFKLQHQTKHTKTSIAKIKQINKSKQQTNKSNFKNQVNKRKCIQKPRYKQHYYQPHKQSNRKNTTSKTNHNQLPEN